MAIGMLDRMYDINWVEAYRVLTSELPLDLGPYVTPLVVADDSAAMAFMQHACCQTYLQRIWKGFMGMETPAWMVCNTSISRFVICAPDETNLNLFSHQSLNKSISQLINQSIINKSINQSINQKHYMTNLCNPQLFMNNGD